MSPNSSSFSIVLALLIAGVTIAASPVRAQPRIAESVVVTANASPVAFENLSRAVTVLTADQIARLPARSVADLLGYIGGVDVQARGPLGVQADFSLRGATFGQTLVLINGARINDVQSGHHNSDIPVALDEIERIEVLHGPGSSLYGADAFGGTINIITRRKGQSRLLALGGGSYDFFSGRATFGAETARLRHAVSASLDRSSGFTFAREFRNVGVSAQTTIDDRTSVLVSHVDKDFGANGFYGASPSKEWTEQTFVGADHERQLNTWSVRMNGSFRRHGDRFLWDVRRPGVLENLHRTHALQATIKGQRPISTAVRMTVGGELGHDWLRSSNLGDHTVTRGSVFTELQVDAGKRVAVHPGLRLDRYSEAGSAWSPSVSLSAWLSARTRLRVGGARAFRVPTFTELYYRDPNHEASGALVPESAWSTELGLDWLADPGWLVSVTPFARWSAMSSTGSGRPRPRNGARPT